MIKLFQKLMIDEIGKCLFDKNILQSENNNEVCLYGSAMKDTLVYRFKELHIAFINLKLEILKVFLAGIGYTQIKWELLNKTSSMSKSSSIITQSGTGLSGLSEIDGVKVTVERGNE